MGPFLASGEGKQAAESTGCILKEPVRAPVDTVGVWRRNASKRDHQGPNLNPFSKADGNIRALTEPHCAELGTKKRRVHRTLTSSESIKRGQSSTSNEKRRISR